MNKKKIAEFLLLKPAFSTRNLTSILLVALFFGVYVASGGKVKSFPVVNPSESNFGDIDFQKTESSIREHSSAKTSNLGLTQTEEDSTRARLFSKPDRTKDKDSSALLPPKSNDKESTSTLDSANRLQALHQRLNKKE